MKLHSGKKTNNVSTDATEGIEIETSAARGKAPKYKEFFIISLAVFIAGFIALGIYTNGYAFKGLFFTDDTDTFMDHFNSIVYNSVDPFENKVIYPPLATITYKFLLNLVPSDEFTNQVTDPTKVAQARTIRISQSFQFQFIIFTIVAWTLLFVSLSLLKKGSRIEKNLTVLLLMFSAPFLFMIERGNNIIIPLAFTAIFVALYESDKKWVRELAIISLAIATGYKIYPLVFGVFLARKKDFFAIVRFGIYCVITLILPFFIFYDGIASIKLLVASIIRVSGRLGTGSNTDGQMDFGRTFSFLYGGFRKVTGITIEEDMVSVYANIFKYLLTAMCVFGAFTCRRRWMAAAYCAMIMYGFPGTCAMYMLSFVAIPAIIFIDEEKKITPTNILCFCAMILMLVPFVIGFGTSFSMYWPTKLTSCAAVGFVIVMFISNIHELSNSAYRRKLIRAGIEVGEIE